MKEKNLLLGLFILLTLLLISCGDASRSPLAITPTSLPIEPTSTPQPFVAGECEPSIDRIEMNTSLTKGYGAGYTPLDMPCSAYCLQVPKGSQLIIGIADLDANLYLNVVRDFYTNWDFGLPDNEGSKVKYQNPSGRYYIYVCPVEDVGEFWSYEGHGDSITFTDATLFSLYNEFLP